jgi:hypothetical protein
MSGNDDNGKCKKKKKAVLAAVYKGKVHYVRLALTLLGISERAKHLLGRFLVKAVFT